MFYEVSRTVVNSKDRVVRTNSVLLSKAQRYLSRADVLKRLSCMARTLNGLLISDILRGPVLHSPNPVLDASQEKA